MAAVKLLLEPLGAMRTDHGGECISVSCQRQAHVCRICVGECSHGLNAFLVRGVVCEKQRHVVMIWIAFLLVLDELEQGCALPRIVAVGQGELESSAIGFSFLLAAVGEQ